MKDLPVVSFRNSFRDQPPYSGWLRLSQLPIGRTLAIELIKEGHLKSVVVAGPGSARGVRLVEAASVSEYFASLPASLPQVIKRGRLASKKASSGAEEAAK